MPGEAWTREWPTEPGWYWVAVANTPMLRPAELRVPGFGRVAIVDGFCHFEGAVAGVIHWGPRIEPPSPPRSSSAA